MGVDNRKIFEEIFEEKLLNKSFRELAEAIITGNKCGESDIAAIRKITDIIVETMKIYYGQHISDSAIEDIKKYCPMELKKYHPHLTFQEVSIGVGMAMRDKFGEIKYQKLSVKLLNELINKYDTSDIRHNIVKIYNDKRDAMVADHKFVSEEEQEAFMLECRLKQFENFKANGTSSVIISPVDYRWLLSKVAVPDYKQFLADASNRIKRRNNKLAPISEVKLLTISIEAEAQRMAVVSLYNQLIKEGVTLEQYLELSTAQT